jgi:hypothetical protein
MNWLVELGIILFTFNALFGPVVAGCLAVLYLFWNAIKTITAYRMMDKIVKGCCDGDKRSKSRAKN